MQKILHVCYPSPDTISIIIAKKIIHMWHVAGKKKEIQSLLRKHEEDEPLGRLVQIM